MAESPEGDSTSGETLGEFLERIKKSVQKTRSTAYEGSLAECRDFAAKTGITAGREEHALGCLGRALDSIEASVNELVTQAQRAGVLSVVRGRERLDESLARKLSELMVMVQGTAMMLSELEDLARQREFMFTQLGERRNEPGERTVDRLGGSWLVPPIGCMTLLVCVVATVLMFRVRAGAGLAALAVTALNVWSLGVMHNYSDSKYIRSRYESCVIIVNMITGSIGIILLIAGLFLQ